MAHGLAGRVRAAFAPPRYLALPLSGIDISTSSIKAARLAEGAHGLVLAGYAKLRLPPGAFADGDLQDRAQVLETLSAAAQMAGIRATNVSLSESKSYLFETNVIGSRKSEWRVAAEQHLGELVPLPPEETAFDLLRAGPGDGQSVPVVGVGFAGRIVDGLLSLFDEAGIAVHALEPETFAASRALLPEGDTSTTLIIDVGKATTKLSIVASRIPRFTTTIGIGGHALTLAVQKHFGVTEEEARKIKAERGITPEPGNEDYLAAMLTTISAIRDEIGSRLEYWQTKNAKEGKYEAVSRAILSGGNAAVRGLPEYFEAELKLPTVLADVFTNLASKSVWVPPLDYTDSLAYAAAVGLALRDKDRL